jgi:2-C-methyl-D-erythritol 2,4-cyclodiphosphate synthase
VGQGFDVHRLVAGRPLILGGVRIEHPAGLEGHSDADVLTHAVADAFLGAMALGDLGAHFPPADPRFRDADSLDLLRRVVGLVREAGGEPRQIDGLLHLERPRIAGHIETMRDNLARAAGLERGRVSVKATTWEGLGLVGRGEGAAASAVVLVRVED